MYLRLCRDTISVAVIQYLDRRHVPRFQGYERMFPFDKVKGTEEAVMANFKIFSDILVEGINKIMKNRRQDN